MSAFEDIVERSLALKVNKVEVIIKLILRVIIL